MEWSLTQLTFVAADRNPLNARDFFPSLNVLVFKPQSLLSNLFIQNLNQIRWLIWFTFKP